MKDRLYKWEITPNPYDSDYDVYVTDDDMDALDTMKAACEIKYDRIGTGETHVVSIKLNEDVEVGSSEKGVE